MTDGAQGEVRIEVVRVAADPRGFVFEPMEAAGLAGHFRNVHVVVSLPNVVRGNHYHVKGTEVCCVAGPMAVRYRSQGEGQVHEVAVPADQVWRFTFPPGVAHAFLSQGDSPTVLAAFNTEEHDPAQPDVVRDVLFA